MRQIVRAVLSVLAGGATGSALSACGGGGARPHSSISDQTESPRRAAAPLKIAEVIFDGKLADGWQDWGWGQHSFVPTEPARIGFGSLGGILLHHGEIGRQYGGLSFRFRAPADYGDFLQVSLKYRQEDESVLPAVRLKSRHLASVDGGWTEALISWNELDPKGLPFDQVIIQAWRAVPDRAVELDHIVLTEGSGGGGGGGGGAIRGSTSVRVAKVAVDCSKAAIPINPLIYGIAGDTLSTGTTARRIGGNPVSRLNWDLGNAWNTGHDWYFENVTTDGSLTDWIDRDLKGGIKTAVVVPLIGWVAKDTTSVGFPVSKLGAQRAHDPYRPEAGDGTHADGSPVTPGPATETSVAAPPEVVARWIEQLRARDRQNGRRSVDQYILDNEPNLWNTTHRDVHPEPLSYDELLDRTIAYGSAIRKADPEAVIAGPAEWGWSGYFYSAKDLVPGRPQHTDRLAHGDVPLLPWYLKKLAEHERRTGRRILDVVDLHFYPQAGGVWGGNAGTDPAASALRLRTTRALWDDSYVDESWIQDRVRLIPRLKEWISQNYPGRGISIGEWNFGAEEHISGGLAVAEVLGRFGQQGIFSAFYWIEPKPGTPAFMAFQAFRNYDGKGARFLDFSIPTREESSVSVFASRDDSGHRMTVVLLNLDPNSTAQADIDVSTCGQVTSRRAFTYDARGPAFLTAGASAGKTPLSSALPPYSITVLDLVVAKSKGPGG